jgi:plastocyanin
MRRLRVISPMLMLMLVGAALTPPAMAETVQITIDQLKYLPPNAKAKVGDTVVWNNKDFVDHTATVNGKWEVVLPAYKSGSLVMKKAGSFDYYCRFHPDMKGRITVMK